jgi:hypothetical protein
MPPVEPLIYRLYEIVQNYGYAYKAVLNEKFGDGIMSAISFSTKVEKETDKDGNNWAVITMRGKWYVKRRLSHIPSDAIFELTLKFTGSRSLDSKYRRNLSRHCDAASSL